MKIFASLLQIIVFSFILVIAGCGGANYAPVVSLVHQANIKNDQYVVQRGDTLYSIAWAFDLDYRDLARVNHLAAPFSLYPGQKLSLRVQEKNKATTYASNRSGASDVVKSNEKDKQWPAVTAVGRHNKHHVNAIKKSKSSRIARKNMPKVAPSRRYSKHLRWSWPAKGKVVKTFRGNLGANNGIDISGRRGESIRASAEGVVVYSGSGVRGYGKLLIVKHNDDFLSAYAYNKKLIVKQGARVRAGQKIATMGLNNQGKSMLHFEIRKNGKPINPLVYLSRNKLA